MAFQKLKCPDCGADIELNAEKDFGFCSYCGTKIMLKQVIEVHHTGLNPKDRKDEEIAEIKKIKDYIYERVDDYNELEKLRNLLNSYKPQASLGLGVIGMLSAIIGILAVLCGGISIATFVFLIVGIVFLCIYLKGVNDDTNTKNEIIETINIRNADLVDYYKEYKNCPIGMQYFCPVIVDKLYGLMRDGRADSIKEALNVYEDDKHKGKMEKQAMIMAQNTAIAAQMSTISAMNSIFRR